MLTVYVHNKCSTCQKALKFLMQKNVLFTSKNIIENPPSLQELREMLHHVNGNLKKLFNTSGQLYRDMQLPEKLNILSTEEALKLLSQHGMLVKRPFLLGERVGLTGFNEGEWERSLH